jgi:hypothetical protein
MPIIWVDIDLTRFKRLLRIGHRTDAAVKQIAINHAGKIHDALSPLIHQISKLPVNEVALKPRLIEGARNCFLYEIEVSALDNSKRWGRTKAQFASHSARIWQEAYDALEPEWSGDNCSLADVTEALCVELVLKKGSFAAKGEVKKQTVT